MKKYIQGYYCRDDLHLQVLNKDSNRRILDALREAYPRGLTIEEIAKKTKLPIKTIYAQKAELYREYYINHLEDEEQDQYKAKRGRPSLSEIRTRQEMLRKRVNLVIEEASGIHDPYDGKKPVPLPPGNVVYSDEFIEAWHQIVEKEEEEELCKILLQFIQKIFNRISQGEIKDQEEDKYYKMIRKWIPEIDIEFCCSQCGLNHEARDFIRAMLLHLIDQLEKYDKFVGFLKDNQLLTREDYDNIILKSKKFKNE